MNRMVTSILNKNMEKTKREVWEKTWGFDPSPQLVLRCFFAKGMVWELRLSPFAKSWLFDHLWCTYRFISFISSIDDFLLKMIYILHDAQGSFGLPSRIWSHQTIDWPAWVWVLITAPRSLASLCASFRMTQALLKLLLSKNNFKTDARNVHKHFQTIAEISVPNKDARHINKAPFSGESDARRRVGWMFQRAVASYESSFFKKSRWKQKRGEGNFIFPLFLNMWFSIYLYIYIYIYIQYIFFFPGTVAERAWIWFPPGPETSSFMTSWAPSRAGSCLSCVDDMTWSPKNGVIHLTIVCIYLYIVENHRSNTACIACAIDSSFDCYLAQVKSALEFTLTAICCNFAFTGCTCS